MEAIGAGRTTCEAVVRACFERIRAREPEVHAWAHIDSEGALERARAFDKDGKGGPLAGVPFGVKDIIDTFDMPTEWGTAIHKGRQPERDAACVALSRKAGGVLLGKTVTTEFANLHPGPTRNPHDLTRTPAGSSSGSAAAVADFMVPIAIGTQTTGSTIRPASFCGVFGYRPTWGDLRATRVMEASGSLDTLGILARSIEDVALYRDVLLGVAPQPVSREPYVPRIGFCRTPAWPHAEPATVRAVETAAEQLRRSGIAVDEVELPGDFAGFLDAQNDVLRYDAARVFAFERTRHPDLLSPSLREELAAGLAFPRSRYLEAQALIARCRSLFATAVAPFECLLAGSAPGEAPRGLHHTGESIFNRLTSGLHVPCITLPGFTGPNGLPVGIQLIGAFGDDARLLRTAKWVAARIDEFAAR